jgi:hypothetical protein
MAQTYGNLNVTPNEILTSICGNLYIAFVIIARASRPNKQRVVKTSIHLTFS